MNSVICGFCGSTVKLEKDGDCPKCSHPISIAEAPRAAQGGRAQVGEKAPASRLSLVFQKNGHTITISSEIERVVIGREGYGKDVLAAVPQVSREHCVIEYLDGQYLVTDLRSTHGTFVGTSKTSALEHPRHALKDGDLLYLGREQFFVTVLSKPAAEPEVTVDASTQASKKERSVDCRNCGYQHPVRPADNICTSCGFGL